MNQSLLSIKDLSIVIEERLVIKNLTLIIEQGTIHALMGPNGSGKSSLAYALMGHPSYQITAGSLLFNGHKLADLSVDKRAQAGLFLVFQYPHSLPGVTVFTFIKEAYDAVHGSIDVPAFDALLKKAMTILHIDESFAYRYLNDGFSGGEKKRLEILQMLILKPTLAILDEVDSGLDIDALKIVARGITLAQAENPSMSILLITHYQRILEYVIPDYVHILCNGRIMQSGNAALVHQIEAKGYDEYTKQAQ
ncbi:MAG: Fe-S cluster assembly ATPase SufC [Candidatus Babeliales bacterium]